MHPFKIAIWFIFLLSIMAATGSFVLQYVFAFEPCVLCILQRLAVLSVGITALISLFSNQQSKIKRAISALIILIPCIWGASVAGYQIWLQSLPPGIAPACGAPWTFRLRDWPLFDLWEPVVRGMGNCAIPDYIMGVPLPIWSILYFFFVMLIVIVLYIKTRSR